MDKKLIIVYCFLLCASLSVTAQERTDTSGMSPADRGWYMGVQGGVPFGISTFSSFGADKTRAGISAGVYGGYRFNPVLSAEISMKWGKTALSAQDCCIEKGYWLGEDGVRYYSPIAGMEGAFYSNLNSRVTLQQYGLQFNVNILGCFNSTRNSRWTLEVSPLLAAVGTGATLKTISGNEEIVKNSTDWHLGAGGNLQAGYRFSNHITAHLYSGITYLTGSRMDGMPKYLHTANYIWENGVKIGFTFGKGCKPRKTGKAAPTIVQQHEEVTTAAVSTIAPKKRTAAQSSPIPAVKENKAETAASEMTDKHIDFPVVYFAFNSVKIADGEADKLLKTLRLMSEYPDLKITITGWCDSRGSRTANDRISLKRAEAVKNWLTDRGIAAARIAAIGKGIDRNEPDTAKARRTDTTKQKED